MATAADTQTQKISASTLPSVVTGLVSLSLPDCTKGSAKSAKLPFAYMIQLLAARLMPLTPQHAAIIAQGDQKEEGLPANG